MSQHDSSSRISGIGPRLFLLAKLALVGLLAACGSDAASKLSISIHGPDEARPFPESVDETISTVRLFSVRGVHVQDVVEKPYTERGVSLPTLGNGSDYWIAVEGLDADGNVIASGATSSFEVGNGNELQNISAFTMEPEQIRPSFAHNNNDNVTVPSQMLSGGRAGHSLTELKGNLGYLVAGGVVMGQQFAGSDAPSITGALDTLEFYNPYTGFYSPVCNSEHIDSGLCEPVTCFQKDECLLKLSQPRGFHAAVRLNNGDVMIIGGLINEGDINRATNQVDVIHPSGDGISASIRTLDPASQALIYPRAFATASRMNDGQIVVLGGMSGVLGDSSNPPSFPTQVEVTPANGSLFSTAQENGVDIAIIPRAMHTTTNVGRRLLVVGGRTADAVVPTSQLIVLDGGIVLIDSPPATDLQVPRFGHSAGVVELLEEGEAFNDVEVMITGGYTEVGSQNLFDGNGVTASAEFYLANQYFFRDTYSTTLITPRAFHSQSALSILGESFVYGGVGENGVPIAPASAGERLTLFPEQLPYFRTIDNNVEITGRAFAQQVTLGSHFALIVGGWSGTNSLDSGAFYNSNDYQFLHPQFE